MDKSLERKVVTFLKQLGLDTEAAQVYIFLLQQGPQTVLGISRGLKTGRTKLYPLLEDLAARQLVVIHERHYGTSYEAQPPDVLEFLVSERERLASGLRSNLPGVVHALTASAQVSPATSRIAEYKGVDGLKQMNWNLMKADGEFRVFELMHITDHLGKHFGEKTRQMQVDKQITSYDLSNDPLWKIDTDVRGYGKVSQGRYIDSKVFKIEFETYIYNNCVALLSYDQDDIFGVEIYNDRLARQQKQLFDLLWSQARAIDN